MSVLNRLIFPSRNFKQLKRETEATRLVAILDKERIDTVIDVGANTGQTADLLRRFGYQGKIISIEPLKDCHEEITKKSAGDPGWIIAPRCAVGDRESMIEILVSEGSSLSSIANPTAAMSEALPKVRAVAREQVPIHRLDRLLKDEIKTVGNIFLKVDAQGHDMQVLRGAEGVMKHITGVKIEMSLFPLYEGETLYLDILKYLDQKGFTPRLLVDVGFSEKQGRQLQIDGTFIRDN